MKVGKSVAIGAFLLVAVGAGADEVDQLIQQGQQAYADKNYPKTVEIFQQVVTTVQARMGAMIEQFFPRAQEGWSAGEVENSSWSGSSGGESHSMINSSRTYTRDADGVEISMMFCNWPTVVQGARAGMQAYTNPMMAQIFKQQGIDFSSEDKDGWQVVTIVEPENDDAQIMAFSDQMMIQVQTKASTADSAKTLFGQIDLAGLDKVLK